MIFPQPSKNGKAKLLPGIVGNKGLCLNGTHGCVIVSGGPVRAKIHHAVVIKAARDGV